MPWIDIPDFVDDTIIRAATFQDIWSNLYRLKDGESDIQYMPGNADDFWFTASTTFVPVDSDYYTLDFEGSGGDLLVIANAEISNSDAAGSTQLTIVMDGVELGGSGGLLSKGPGDIFEALQLLYVIEQPSAGVHTIYVAMKQFGGVNAKVFKKSCMNFSITELN